MSALNETSDEQTIPIPFSSSSQVLPPLDDDSTTAVSPSLNETDDKMEDTLPDQHDPDNVLIDHIEGSEDEIQKQQIANIYRLLNDQHLINNWSSTDFLDQLKMYGLCAYDENELHAD
jgi:hypothetical protein